MMMQQAPADGTRDRRCCIDRYSTIHQQKNEIPTETGFSLSSGHRALGVEVGDWHYGLLDPRIDPEIASGVGRSNCVGPSAHSGNNLSNGSGGGDGRALGVEERESSWHQPNRASLAGHPVESLHYKAESLHSRKGTTL